MTEKNLYTFMAVLILITAVMSALGYTMGGMAYTMAIICIVGVCNFFTRALPFLIFSRSTQLPDFARYLGQYLPACVMAVLLIYCVRGISFTSIAGFLPTVIAVASVAVIHIIKRNNLISIACGTVIYMVLIRIL